MQYSDRSRKRLVFQEAMSMSEKKVIVYNKLVRDRIPEIIGESGKSCVTKICSF